MKERERERERDYALVRKEKTANEFFEQSIIHFLWKCGVGVGVVYFDQRTGTGHHL